MVDDEVERTEVGGGSEPEGWEGFEESADLVVAGICRVTRVIRESEASDE